MQSYGFLDDKIDVVNTDFCGGNVPLYNRSSYTGLFPNSLTPIDIDIRTYEILTKISPNATILDKLKHYLNKNFLKNKYQLFKLKHLKSF